MVFGLPRDPQNPQRPSRKSSKQPLPRRKAPSHQRRRRLFLESLEDRRVLANVGFVIDELFPTTFATGTAAYITAAGHTPVQLTPASLTPANLAPLGALVVETHST